MTNDGFMKRFFKNLFGFGTKEPIEDKEMERSFERDHTKPSHYSGDQFPVKPVVHNEPRDSDNVLDISKRMTYSKPTSIIDPIVPDPMGMASNKKLEADQDVLENPLDEKSGEPTSKVGSKTTHFEGAMDQQDMPAAIAEAPIKPVEEVIAKAKEEPTEKVPEETKENDTLVAKQTKTVASPRRTTRQRIPANTEWFPPKKKRTKATTKKTSSKTVSKKESVVNTKLDKISTVKQTPDQAFRNKFNIPDWASLKIYYEDSGYIDLNHGDTYRVFVGKAITHPNHAKSLTMRQKNTTRMIILNWSRSKGWIIPPSTKPSSITLTVPEEAVLLYCEMV